MEASEGGVETFYIRPEEPKMLRPFVRRLNLAALLVVPLGVIGVWLVYFLEPFPAVEDHVRLWQCVALSAVGIPFCVLMYLGARGFVLDDTLAVEFDAGRGELILKGRKGARRVRAAEMKMLYWVATGGAGSVGYTAESGGPEALVKMMKADEAAALCKRISERLGIPMLNDVKRNRPELN